MAGNGYQVGTGSAQQLGFYGATAVDQPASASQAAVTASATATTTQLRTDLDATIVLCNQLRSELVSLGLITGAA